MMRFRGEAYSKTENGKPTFGSSCLQSGQRKEAHATFMCVVVIVVVVLLLLVSSFVPVR